MTIYETNKAAVTPGQAAEHYGLQIGRNNMTCRPFRKDRDNKIGLLQKRLRELGKEDTHEQNTEYECA